MHGHTTLPPRGIPCALRFRLGDRNPADVTELGRRILVERKRFIMCKTCSHSIKPYNARLVSGRMAVRCPKCGHHISLLTGTVFQDSRVPISIWLRAFGLFVQTSEGLSASGLQQKLSIGSYRTALEMMRKIRALAASVNISTSIPGGIRIATGKLPLSIVWPTIPQSNGVIEISTLSSRVRVHLLHTPSIRERLQTMLTSNTEAFPALPPECQTIADSLIPWLKRIHRKPPTFEYLQQYLDEFVFHHTFNTTHHTVKQGFGVLVDNAFLPRPALKTNVLKRNLENALDYNPQQPGDNDFLV